jgi:hypothetical protein
MALSSSHRAVGRRRLRLRAAGRVCHRLVARNPSLVVHRLKTRLLRNASICACLSGALHHRWTVTLCVCDLTVRCRPLFRVAFFVSALLTFLGDDASACFDGGRLGRLRRGGVAKSGGYDGVRDPYPRYLSVRDPTEAHTVRIEAPTLDR